MMKILGWVGDTLLTVGVLLLVIWALRKAPFIGPITRPVVDGALSK